MKSILHAAADLVAQIGYDGVTMTAIAEHAHTSIGSLYQYFPDRDAVMQALVDQYREELEARWVPLMDVIGELTPAQTADRLVDLLADFFEARPAYLALHDAPHKLRRSPAARDRLRRRIAQALSAQQRGLSKDEALLIGSVAIQILKGVGALYARGTAQERASVVREIKFALCAYLTARFRSRISG